MKRVVLLVVPIVCGTFNDEEEMVEEEMDEEEM